MLDRRNIVEEARTWIGVPWRHQGRSIYGIDCAGLIIVISKKFGFIDPEYKYENYQRRTSGASFLKPFKALFDRKPIDKVQPGDILLFRDSIFPCHSTIAGLRRDQLTIIHAHQPVGKVVEDDLNQGDWMHRRVACFEFRGLSNG